MESMRSHSEVPARRRQMNLDIGVVDAAVAGWPLGRRHGEQEEDQRLQKSSGAAEDEIEGLIQQFALLKPCRQLEKQFETKRNAHEECHGGDRSFRHGGEAMAQGRDQRLDARTKPRRKLEENSQCRVQESDAKPATIREVLSTYAERGRDDATRAAEEAERAHSISAAEQRALARKQSRDSIELYGFVADDRIATPRRSVSERFATRDFHRDVWRISSTRCSIHEKDAHIDLVAPAAAKFLVETATPRTRQFYYNASPPAVAVPFQWEDAPGRAKPATAARASPDALQLPPRLAAPATSRPGQSFSSRELRFSAVVSHPLAGLFPCMTASSPSWSHHHRVRDAPPIKPSLHARKLNKSFSQPLASTDASPTPKPRRLFSAELRPDPTSILHHSGRHSSGSSRTYLSCDLDASTPRSKSSSSVSYESVGEDFIDSPRSDGVKGLRKLGCLRKSRSRAQRLCNPEVWSYLQHLDVNSHNHEDVTLLPVGGAPTSSGYLNARGEPVAISTEGATRLPYKMPSVEEQERAARAAAQRESGAAVEGFSGSGSTSEILSPAVSVMTSRRQRGGPRQPSGWVGAPKPHRRVQFILSVCKTLKRVLFRQQPRRSVIGTRLMYYEERAPTTFQFSKPN